MAVTQEETTTSGAPVTLETLLTPKVYDFLASPRKMLINGEWNVVPSYG